MPTSTGVAIEAVSDSGRSGEFALMPLTDRRFARRDLVLIAASAKAAVTAAKLSGTVVTDSVGRPIADAQVTLDDLGLTAFSDSAGTFRLTAIPPGSHRVSARHLGYSPQMLTLDFVAGGETRQVFSMRRVVTLDSVLVAASQAPRDPGMEAFAEHKARGFGRFVTRAELEKQSGRSVAAIMEQLEGVGEVPGRQNQAWIMSRRGTPMPPRCSPASRGTSRIDPDSWFRAKECYRREGWYLPDDSELDQGMKPGCYALVYVDKALMNPTFEPFDLNSLIVSQIEALEWYSGMTQIPPEYASRVTRCGVLVVHTRRG